MRLSQSNQPNSLGRARLGHAHDTDLTPWEEQQARNTAPEFAAEWESQSQTAVSRSPSSYSEMEPPHTLSRYIRIPTKSQKSHEPKRKQKT